MSKYWRNELLPAERRNPDIGPHPSCKNYDIESVEKGFLETRLYAAFYNHPNLSIMNRPSIDDGELDGTYCSSYNQLMWTQGSDLNQGQVDKNFVLHVTTGGKPRTATTFQFNAACVSLFLSVRRNRPDLLRDLECTFSGDSVSSSDFTENKPQVIKSHKDFGDVTQNEDGTGVLVFSTAKTRAKAIETHHALVERGYRMGFIQDIDTLSDIGDRGMLARYTETFGLGEDDAADLNDYILHWDVLRMCCGKQMSKHWRHELLPADKRNPSIAKHPSCGTYDIESVERGFLETRLYAEFASHMALRVMNRPSLVDGDLDGTYCLRYNDLVRTQGVKFNEGTV